MAHWIVSLLLFASVICMIYCITICAQISVDPPSSECVIAPSKRIRRSAILVSFLMATTFMIRLAQPILIEGITSNHDMKNIFNLLYVVNMTTIYFHLLSRLRDSFNNSAYHTRTPSKKLYHSFIALLMIYLLVPLLHTIFDINDSHKYSYPRTCGQVCIVWIAVEFTINAVLTYLYGYALVKYVKYCYGFEYVTKRDRTRADEAHIKKLNLVMIELRRHTVIAFVICAVNMLLSMMFIALKVINSLSIIETIVVTSILIKQMVAMQSIYNGFHFANNAYKRCCCCCDTWMKRRCTKNVKKWVDVSELNLFCDTPIQPTIVCPELQTQVIRRHDTIVVEDYHPKTDVQLESHPDVANMINAEENVAAVAALSSAEMSLCESKPLISADEL